MMTLSEARKEMSKKTFTKEEMQEKAMTLWERYGERYRNLIPKYEKLLLRKKELKIRPLNEVARSTLNELPEIELLSIRSKKAARARIKKMSSAELSAAIMMTEMMVDGYAFRTIESHIYDFEYEIRHHGEKHLRVGAIDPGYVKRCAFASRRTHAETN